MSEPNPRPTHFLAVRLLHPSLHQLGRSVQSSIKRAFPELASGITSTDKLHITLGVISLSNEDEILQARASLRAFVAESLRPLLLSGQYRRPHLCFRDTECLGSFDGARRAINVLYLQPSESSSSDISSSMPPPLPLQTLSALAMSAMTKAALKTDATTGLPIADASFEPHATLWKQSKMGKRANSKPLREARVTLRHSLENLPFWDQGSPLGAGRDNALSKSGDRVGGADIKRRHVERADMVSDVTITTVSYGAEKNGVACQESPHHKSRRDVARSTSTSLVDVEADGSGCAVATSSVSLDVSGEASINATNTSALCSIATLATASRRLECAYNWPRGEDGKAIEIIEEIGSVLLCSMVRPGPRRLSGQAVSTAHRGIGADDKSRAGDGSNINSNYMEVDSAETKDDNSLGASTIPEMENGFGLYPDIDGFYYVEEEVAI